MRRFLTVPTAILTVVLLIPGCTSSDDTAEEPTTAIPAATVAAPVTATTVATTTTTTEATTTVVPTVATELRLTFLEGGGCTYEGPTELRTGPVELIYVNESDVWSRMNFVILDEGYAVQDAIDDFGQQPSTRPGPSWMKAMGTFEAVAAGSTLSWRFDLEAGVYVMVCGWQRPRQGWEGWFGAGLTVEE